MVEGNKGGAWRAVLFIFLFHEEKNYLAKNTKCGQLLILLHLLEITSGMLNVGLHSKQHSFNVIFPARIFFCL